MMKKPYKTHVEKFLHNPSRAQTGSQATRDSNDDDFAV
jgi:hypothetical protein